MPTDKEKVLRKHPKAMLMSVVLKNDPKAKVQGYIIQDSSNGWFLGTVRQTPESAWESVANHSQRVKPGKVK